MYTYIILTHTYIYIYFQASDENVEKPYRANK